MKKSMQIFVPFFFFLLIALFYTPTTASGSAKINWPGLHKPWQNLLTLYVKDGKVDYKTWRQNHEPLKSYLQSLNNIPAQDLKEASPKDRMALYINAYNAFTIELILNNEKIKTIRDIEPNAWNQEIVHIAQKNMSLDHLENNILRPEFNDPRIHFAIVCAALSCPPLSSTAFTANNIDSLLDSNTKMYLKNPAHNYFSGNYTELSKIFEWFLQDFEKFPGGIKAFLKKYAPIGYDAKKEIRYKEYDWSLNQK